MKTIIGWTVFIGVLWFFGYVGVETASIVYPNTELSNIRQFLVGIGAGLGKFIAPILQLALVIVILIEAARRLNLLPENGNPLKIIPTDLRATNVQGYIAILIVASVSVASLAYGSVDTLKDLALVVVGFYFGTRRSQVEAEAIAAGVARGAAESSGQSTIGGLSSSPTVPE